MKIHRFYSTSAPDISVSQVLFFGIFSKTSLSLNVYFENQWETADVLRLFTVDAKEQHDDYSKQVFHRTIEQMTLPLESRRDHDDVAIPIVL
uniref:Coatomer subunit delta n=1 Tax=Heterorhabditis bacteriophora TaxID=37862 RepID=A0A1I7W635_HETBA